MKFGQKNSFNCIKKLNINGKNYNYFSLAEAEKNGLSGISRLPNSLKILLENLLRFEDDLTVNTTQIEALKNWLTNKSSKTEIAYKPSRILMQDYTGIPAIADLAAMRDAVKSKNIDPKKINPLLTVDLVIDHSVMVDNYASQDSFNKNVEKEFSRNGERYSFLKWGQNAFNNLRVVPPGTGICHQVNLEYLAKVVWSSKLEGNLYAYPDTLVGTDSHTTMVNGLSVLGWGVGGIEAEAAMLGQPISMLIPEVVGFEITGKLNEGTTATDLVLTIVQMLRKKNVVGKFVEFFGEGLKNLTLADRATIANMAPEYGATCGFFPIDSETIKYLIFSGREKDIISLVETYAKEQKLWASDDLIFTDTLNLNLSTVVPSIAGPKRPQDKVLLSDSLKAFESVFKENTGRTQLIEEKVDGENFKLHDGDIVIAAITSCTNTSNPHVLIGAGLLAKKAIENKCPYIIFTSSGGARMQEGIISLMQMPRTVAAVELLNQNKIPYIVVLTEPTTGGVTASFAMLGDITIAEKGSTIGFAGKRVIQDTIREELPIDFQKAEYLHEHGMVDIIVHRKDLKKTLSDILHHIS